MGLARVDARETGRCGGIPGSFGVQDRDAATSARSIPYAGAAECG